MSGRKVRCRHCGTVFALGGGPALAPVSPAALHTDAPHERPSFGDDLGMLGMTEAASSVRRLTQSSEAGAPAEDDFQSELFATEGDTLDAPLDRSSRMPAFPMQGVLEAWLPWVIVLLAISWAAGDSWSSAAGQPKWVGPFRFALALLAFLAVVFPFTYMATLASLRRLRLPLPHNVGWRIAASFSLPAAMAYALWLMDGSITNLILGAVGGLLAGLPTLWLLLRLGTRYGGHVLTRASIWFLASVAVVGSITFILNMALVSIVRSTRPVHALVASPFGPGLKWDGLIAPKSVAPAPAAKDAPAPDASAEVAQALPAEQAPPSPPTVDNGGTTASAAPTRVESSIPDELANSPVFGNPGAGSSKPAPAAGDAASPIVDRTDLYQGDADRLALPTIPSQAVGLVARKGAVNEQVTRFDLKAQRAGVVALFAAEDSTDGTYHLSPGGASVARIAVTFNIPMVQVWSFEQNRAEKGIRLDGRIVSPSIVAFPAAEQIVLQGRRGDRATLEVWNPITGSLHRNIELVRPIDPSPRALAVSPDGVSIAALAPPESAGTRTWGAEIEIYSTATGKLQRRLPITQFPWDRQVQVAAVSFTPDSKRVAALFEHHGKGMFVCWDVQAAPRILQQYPLQAGLSLDGRETVDGPMLHWLADGDAWLLNGSQVYATRSGALLTSLGISRVRAQFAAGRDACYLLHTGDDDQTALTRVRFDIAKLRSAINAAG